MPKKKCAKGKTGVKVEGKDYTCLKCGANSNNKDKLCKPIKK